MTVGGERERLLNGRELGKMTTSRPAPAPNYPNAAVTIIANDLLTESNSASISQIGRKGGPDNDSQVSLCSLDIAVLFAWHLPKTLSL